MELRAMGVMSPLREKLSDMLNRFCHSPWIHLHESDAGPLKQVGVALGLTLGSLDFL